MACNRCGGQYASDGAELRADFTTPNGMPLYLNVRMTASADALGIHAAMFCPQCWVFFLETFGQRATAERILHG